MNRIKSILGFIKEAFDEWTEDKVPRLAAALAYYTAFSIAPLLVIVIAVAGLAFGQDAVRGEIVRQIQGTISEDSAEMIQSIIANAYQPDVGIFATVIGIGSLVLGAAGLFSQLQDALNTIWEVKPKPSKGILYMIKERFISFTMVLGIGFLLLVSLVLSTVLSTVANYAQGFLPQTELIAQVVNLVISFGSITLLFAMIYKILPDVNIAWKDVWVGAAITALLFTIGKSILSLYLGGASVASAYGAAGSFIVILLWIYYSAQILLFGAEITQVYARRYGSHIEPSENAIRVTEMDRAQQGITRPETAQAIEAAPLTRPVMVNISPQEKPEETARNDQNFFIVTLTIINTILAAFIAAGGRRQRAKR